MNKHEQAYKASNSFYSQLMKFSFFMSEEERDILAKIFFREIFDIINLEYITERVSITGSPSIFFELSKDDIDLNIEIFENSKLYSLYKNDKLQEQGTIDKDTLIYLKHYK